MSVITVLFFYFLYFILYCFLHYFVFKSINEILELTFSRKRQIINIFFNPEFSKIKQILNIFIFHIIFWVFILIFNITPENPLLKYADILTHYIVTYTFADGLSSFILTLNFAFGLSSLILILKNNHNSSEYIEQSKHSFRLKMCIMIGIYYTIFLFLLYLKDSFLYNLINNLDDSFFYNTIYNIINNIINNL